MISNFIPLTLQELQIEFEFDFSEYKAEFDEAIKKLQAFLETCETTMLLSRHELDAWDIADPKVRAEHRESVRESIGKRLIASNLTTGVLVGPRKRMIAIFQVDDGKSTHMTELESYLRLPLDDEDDGDESDSISQLPTPYERVSDELFACLLSPDGQQEIVDIANVEHRLGVYNYMLTDEVVIFWDPESDGNLNYPAMGLVRDAESINFEYLLDQHEFLEDIFGDAIIVEGIDEVDGFGA